MYFLFFKLREWGKPPAIRPQMHLCGVALIVCGGKHRSLPLHCAYIFLCLLPGDHQLVATAQAVQAKIRTGAKHLPTLFSAGMGFLHGKNVIYTDVHRHFLSARSFPLDRFPILLCRLLQLVGAVFIIMSTNQLIGQILLLDPMVGKIMGIQISLLPFHGIGHSEDVGEN